MCTRRRLSSHRSYAAFLTLTLALTAVPSQAVAQDEPAGSLEVGQGARISLIGNTLADRMQHDGWLETYFYSRFPRHDLVFRNLGFSGDELTLRLRSQSFGSPDEWLTRTKTDMVFAFFGYNESFAGKAGLPKFKNDLDGFVKHTLKQKYNGQGAPRLVLFSPIAHEPPHDRNLPDATAANKRLEAYTAAMAEVAKANGVPFVDLFHPTQALYAKATEPLTINGIHLSERGDEELAKVIDQALFPGAPAPKRETERLEKTRQAVLDRNFYWFNRYRTVDGFNVFGGRADLKYTDGISNRDVMQREMAVLDVMTANRDKRVWAVAQGGDLKVDDGNAPPFIPVKTNLPGPLPGGKHVFLDGEAEIGKMTVARGLKVNLFASEKDFPELVNPVQMEFDTKGRLWVAVWPTYPHWKPGEPMNDKLIVLEDTKGTGKADKLTVFADHLHCPTGFTFYNGGVLVAQAPDLLFLKDTDGDGKADVRKRVLHGLDSADTHHTANSFVYDPGGALYFQEGTFHHTQVESPYGPPERCANGGVFRYEPRTQKFEVYVGVNFANPHGHVFDRWGRDIAIDGTGANPYDAALFSGRVEFPHRHSHPPQVYRPKTRPCPGAEVLSSRHFPEDMQGHLLVANVIGFRGILQYRLVDRGASFIGQEVEPILSSSDPNFRPADIRIGPDGAIYFTDWHNPIIGHMQHHIRDPNRDREHGRVYRVTCEGRPLLKSPSIAGEPVVKLLELLKQPEDRVRYRARIELGGRDSAQVIAALEKWTAALDRKDAAYEHNLLESLWLNQSHNVVNEDLLRRLLRSPEPRARTAATRVLCYWRDRVREPLELLRTQINDDSPRVRLEAIRALSFFHTEAALGVAVELLTHPDDEYLRFVFNETLNTLERRLGSGTKLNRGNIAASLVQMLEKGKVPAERQPVLLETICRHGGAKELTVVWEHLVKGHYPPTLRKSVLEWLVEAAATRRVQPVVDAHEIEARLQAILRSRTEYATEAVELVRATGAWKVRAGIEHLRALAQEDQAPQAVRLAALDALTAFAENSSVQALRDLSLSAKPMVVRFHAAAALGHVDLTAGARAAAAAIAGAAESDDPAPLVEAFLAQKGGSKQLAAALGKEKLSADAAKRILRAMYLAGRNDPVLGDLAARRAGIEAAPKPPTPDEVRRLADEVLAKGDASRGERVFRRADLGCIKCHAINRAGGNIGPDLGPIGGTSPLDYIITSILDPSASIKEEYLTKTVVTTAGQLVTGIVVERGKNHLVLKEATGKRTRIPTADIEEETAGKSLMPEGITRILTKGELLDLIRFVGELGKPGPFAVRTAGTVQRWHRLRDVPASLREGVPNRDVIRDSILRAGPAAWETVYSLVGGTLPLDELKAGRGEVLYLQGEVNVVQAGGVEVRLDAGGPAVFWVDEEPFESRKAVVRLTPGRHLVTVRVVAGESPRLRVELLRPAESRAHFEVVQSD
jgi:putative heme-binding domain-containing protein